MVHSKWEALLSHTKLCLNTSCVKTSSEAATALLACSIDCIVYRHRVLFITSALFNFANKDVYKLKFHFYFLECFHCCESL